MWKWSIFNKRGKHDFKVACTVSQVEFQVPRHNDKYLGSIVPISKGSSFAIFLYNRKADLWIEGLWFLSFILMGYNDIDIQSVVTQHMTVNLYPVIVSVSRRIKPILKLVFCICWEKQLGQRIYLELPPKNILKYRLRKVCSWTLETSMMGNLKYGFNLHGLK